MTLKVIGTGLSRTRTVSTRMALEHLGIGQYHHMMLLFADPTQVAIWPDVARVNAMQLIKSGRRLRGPQNLLCPHSVHLVTEHFANVANVGKRVLYIVTSNVGFGP